ncbi:MAG: GNAT family N-acetyltransferase [Pararhodobacter sp.]|nr:GNAT family N-acetyltransferase [Pararhodobacter sp.]
MSSPHVTQPNDGFGPPVRQGDWLVRAAGPGERASLAALRGLAFRGGGRDGDAFDARCLHLWVEKRSARHIGPLATARLQIHPPGDVGHGYAAQYFDLRALAAAPGAALELGRLCVHPDHATPQALRMIWAGVTRVADRAGAARLIGCTSFTGTEPSEFEAALNLLAARHLGPAPLRPAAVASETINFAARPAAPPGPEARNQMPPLLRGYLSLGGWVGGQLVIDRDLGTCHVFTCVEIATMPEPRKKLLRALAGTG